MRSPASPAWVLLLLLAPVVVVSYLPAIDGPFLFDDQPNIVANPAIAGSRDLGDVLAAAFSPANPNRLRPLANASLALNAATTGMDPAPFRWVNVALLWLSGGALLLFASAACRAAGHPDRAAPTAAAAAVLWTLSPLHTNDVTYIVQRMALLANGLSLLALALYLEGRRRGRLPLLAGAGLAGLLALGSKQSAAILPLAALLLEVTLLAGRHPARRRRLLGGGLILCVGSFLLLAGWRYAGLYAVRDFTMAQRLLTEPRVVLSSLGLYLLPLPQRLSVEHDIAVSTGLFAPPTTLLAAAALLGLLALAVAAARRHPLPSACALLFLLHLLIEFTVIPLELMFEHRILLPAAFLTVAAAYGAVGAARRAVPREIPRRLVGALALAALAGGLAAGTWARNRVWTSEISLWEDAARKAPARARVWNNLGLSYDIAGRKRDAERAFLAALERDPAYLEARSNLALLYESVGMPAAAVGVLRGAPGDRPPRGHAGYAALNEALAAELSGRTDEAIAGYRAAIRLFPNRPEVAARLARLLNNGGRYSEAVEATGIPGADPYLLNERGRALAGLGRKGEAMETYARNTVANPAFAASWFNLGVLCYDAGDRGCATERLTGFLALAPDDPLAPVARGILGAIAGSGDAPQR